jgi:hypothetical protein
VICHGRVARSSLVVPAIPFAAVLSRDLAWVPPSNRGSKIQRVYLFQAFQ